MNKESVMALLGEINDENSDRDLVSAGAVREVGIHEDSVSVDIRLGYHLADRGEELAAMIKSRLESDSGIEKAGVNISSIEQHSGRVVLSLADCTRLEACAAPHPIMW